MNNLLIVEDYSFIMEKIIKEAKEINIINNIHISKTIKEAIEILETRNIEVITLDLSLPDGSGLEVLGYLKEKNIDKKVLVFSSSRELKEICLRYGAIAFYDKANDFDTLIENLKVI